MVNIVSHELTATFYTYEHLNQHHTCPHYLRRSLHSTCFLCSRKSTFLVGKKYRLFWLALLLRRNRTH